MSLKLTYWPLTFKHNKRLQSDYSNTLLACLLASNIRYEEDLVDQLFIPAKSDRLGIFSDLLIVVKRACPRL